MRTQNRQGSFITLIRTLLTKAKEVSDVAANADTQSSPIHPRAEVVANLLVLRAISVRMQERLAEEERLAERVFRYSSSDPCAAGCSSLRIRGLVT